MAMEQDRKSYIEGACVGVLVGVLVFGTASFWSIDQARQDAQWWQKQCSAAAGMRAIEQRGRP